MSGTVVLISSVATPVEDLTSVLHFLLFDDFFFWPLFLCYHRFLSGSYINLVCLRRKTALAPFPLLGSIIKANGEKLWALDLIFFCCII